MTDRSLQLATTSMTIFHLTDINTILLDKFGSIVFSHERDSMPDFLVERQQEEFILMLKEIKMHDNECCMFTNEWELSYLASLFELDGEEVKVIIHGPFLKQAPDINKLFEKFSVDNKKKIILEEFFQSLKLLSNGKIQSIANILNKLSSIQAAPLSIIEPDEILSKQLQDTSLYKMLQQPDEKYAELIDLRYEIEKEMLHAVAKGDKIKLQEILARRFNLFNFPERFPNKPIRAMKVMLIVLNTLYRTAARNGEVPPFFLHHISEKFSLHIERAESINELNKLETVMAEEYCDLVRKRAHLSYSLLVQKALNFITVHFSKPLNLNKLAQHCLVHPAHLSRQFKKETGMTLTEYLHKQRIEEAKLLLKKERTSIEWVAGFVGFEDAAYFSRVFKKIEGVTPTQYRNF